MLDWICEMRGPIIKGWSHRRTQRTMPFIKAIKNTLMREAPASLSSLVSFAGSAEDSRGSHSSQFNTHKNVRALK